MKIDGSLYEHEPIRGKKLRGCLLRVRFGAWRIGYADLHPWIEYGDATIEEQFSLLAAGRSSRLMQRSLYLAEQDAEGRRQQRGLLAGLHLPVSHMLLASPFRRSFDDAYERGFRHFKIKMGADIQAETAFLKETRDARLRLDFNGHPSFLEFSEWWKTLDNACRSRIDVIEDAFSGEGEIAQPDIFYSDWIVNLKWRGRVLKPARDAAFAEYRLHRFPNVIFTHSLDHPLAQAGALWEAARFYQQYPFLRQPGGFSKTDGFEEFYQAWDCEGPRRRPTPGTGFGFDRFLESLPWQRRI